MHECFMIFRRSIERELSKRITSEFDVIMVDDVCRVRINCDNHTWGYTIYDISYKLMRGFDVNSIIDEILRAYKKWVLRKYFI